MVAYWFIECIKKVLTNKEIKTYGLIALIAILIYANRGSINPIKKPLDADNDSDDAIGRALSKIKTGSVKVNSTPEDVRREAV